MIIFLPLKDTRVWSDKLRAIKFAVAINLIALALIYLGSHLRDINYNVSIGIIFLTAIFGTVANAFFCIPYYRLISEDKKYFYLKYNNRLQNKPFSGFTTVQSSSYGLNILIAVCLASIPYGFLFSDFLLTKILLIGGLCFGIFMTVFVRYLQPYAKFSAGEHRVLSKISGWSDGNLYETREFLVSFFDVIFCLVVIIFWLVAIKLIFVG